jgi:hypothetical protein
VRHCDQHVGAGLRPAVRPLKQCVRGPLRVRVRRADTSAPAAGRLHRAGGRGQRYSQSFWLWPLPPEGPFSFVCEWPALDIGLTRVEVDSALFHEAAAPSRALWDDDTEIAASESNPAS